MKHKIIFKLSSQKLFLVLLLLLFTQVITIYAQSSGKITGVVKDGSTDEPLPGVNVVISGTTMGGATDIEGRYFIINVPVGTYNLEATMIGYTKVIKTDVLVTIDRTTNIDFSLSETVIAGQEVTVVAERDILHKEVANSQQVVTSEQITNAPAVLTMGEYLSKQVGVTDPSNLTIRGGSPDQTATLVNGISFVDSRLGRTESSIPLSAIEQVSVVSGGFNAEYGNFRSGLINVVTKTGDQKEYHGRFDFSMNDAHQKRFGKSMYDPQNFYLRPMMDPNVAFVGTQTAWGNKPDLLDQYKSFLGWDKYADDYNANVSSDADKVTPLDLYLWNAWMRMSEPDFKALAAKGYSVPAKIQQAFKDHAHEPEGSDSDLNFDGGFGGPIPVIGKKLGNATFYLSNNTYKKYYVQPVVKDAEKQQLTMLTLQSNITSNLKISVDGLYRNTQGVSNFFFDNTMNSDNASLMNIDNLSNYVDAGNRYWWYPTYYSPEDQYTSMLGVNINHVLSPKTYWTLSLNTVKNEERISTPYTRNNTILVRVGPIPLDERPYGNSQGHSILDGYEFNEYEQPYGTSDRWANKAGDIHGISNTRQYRLKFDFSSQVNYSNLIRIGTELNYSKIDNILWGWRWYHTEDTFENTWNASPLQAGFYAQDQIALNSLVANLGVRFDYYHPGGEWPTGDIYSNAGFAPEERPSDLYETLKTGNSTAWEIWQALNNTSPGFLQSTKNHLAVSPRIGLSFPVTDRSKFYFNYGHFRSTAPYINMFSYSYDPGDGYVTQIGNPNLAPPRTISYELGVEYNLLEQYLVRIATYYKDVTGQHGDVSYNSTDGHVAYDSFLNNEYQDITGFELSITKSFGDFLSGWINYNYMISKNGLIGREEFYQDPSKQAFFGLYEGQESRPLPQPRLTANVSFHTPNEWGPSVFGYKMFGNVLLSLLPTWQSGRYFTWNPLGKFHLSDNLQWPDYFVTDAKFSKGLNVAGIKFEAYLNIRNIFNKKVNLMYTGMPFDGSSDQRKYLASLHLPMYDSPEFDDLRQNNPGLYVAGDDKPGMTKSSDKPYINDPNRGEFLYAQPRDIWFGFRILF